jgi:hypothetical protein
VDDMDLAEDANGTHSEDGAGAKALFPADTGELPFDARRALVRLLRGPSLDEEKNGYLWAALIQEERRIRSRLSDLFLELVIDREARVAFVRQAETPDLDAPRLLQRVTLTYMQSVVLLELRMILAAADARGERATVAHDELMTKLQAYDSGNGTDHAGFSKRVNSAIVQIVNKGFMKKIQGAQDRYEISAVLKLLFSLDQVRALEGSYRQFACTGGLGDDEAGAAADGELG